MSITKRLRELDEAAWVRLRPEITEALHFADNAVQKREQRGYFCFSVLREKFRILRAAIERETGGAE